MIHRLALAASMLALAACQATETPTENGVAAELRDPVPVPDFVRAALADPERAAHRGADARRRPGEH